MKYSTKTISKESITNIPTESEKIIWKRSPELFFILFSAMIEERYIGTRKNRVVELQTAKKLYDAFYVLPKSHDKKEYTFNTFYQNIKSSGNLMKDIKYNILLKSKISKFLKTLEPEDLSLFK
jgi:hypothetical protein